jgi:hypothetical protein
MASKQVIEKLLGSLLFEPNGVKFDVKDSSSSNSEFKSYLIDVYVDPNRFHRIGDDYDPQYSKFMNELDDNVYETLKYVGGDDIDYSIQFKHLDPKFKKKLDDILRSLFKKIEFLGKPTYETYNFETRVGLNPELKVILFFDDVTPEIKEKVLMRLYTDLGDELGDFMFVIYDPIGTY